MEGVVASLANRLDALVVSIQHVDVDDTDELENFCVRLESLYADLIETDLSFGGLIPSQVIQNVFECWKQFQDVEVSIPGRPAFEISHLRVSWTSSSRLKTLPQFLVCLEVLFVGE